MSGPFERTRTLLSQQTYPGSQGITHIRELGTDNPPDGNSYTTYLAECPECGERGKVKSYHGTNCFWDCRNCGAKLKD